MKKIGNSLLLMTVAGTLVCVPAGFAQQAEQQNQYQGVSRPPSNDDIVTTPDEPAAPPAAKPSPVVHATTQTAATAPASAVPATTAAPVVPAASKPAYNPDDDIVTSAVPEEASSTPAPAPAMEASLASRPKYNPDADIVSYVPSSNNELAEGTNIRARMLETLSTRETNPGTAFKAQITSDVYKNGKVIIPAGSELRGRVVSVTQGHHFGSPATLRLRPDIIILPDGTAYHFYGQVVESKAPNTRTDREGGIQPASHMKRNAVEYGAAAGTGALVGAKLAGPQGALVGTLVGAGVVSFHLLTQHPQMAEVPSGSVVTFSLTEPMDLTPTRN